MNMLLTGVGGAPSQENKKESLEKVTRFTFTDPNIMPLEEKYLELTEKEPGTFLINEGDLTDSERTTLAFHPDYSKMENIEILDEGDEQYDTFAHTRHFRFEDVEVDARDHTHMFIKAPSVNRALEILKMSNPIAYDPHDI